MNSIIMVIQDRIWRLEKVEGAGMVNVGMFLASDVAWDGADDFSEWLLDETVQQMEGNYSLLRKQKSNVVINCKYAVDFDKESVSVSLDALVDLLQQWKKVCDAFDEKMSGAKVTYNGSKFEVIMESH